MANLPQIEKCDFFFLRVHMKYTFYKYWSGVKKHLYCLLENAVINTLYINAE